MRVRSYGGRSFLTIKSGGDETRVEEEVEIDARRFRSLWPLTEGRRISKRRYLLPAAGNATPATYQVNGRQFVVIAAGGGKLGVPSGASYVAFALPQ